MHFDENFLYTNYLHKSTEYPVKIFQFDSISKMVADYPNICGFQSFQMYG